MRRRDPKARQEFAWGTPKAVHWQTTNAATNTGGRYWVGTSDLFRVNENTPKP